MFFASDNWAGAHPPVNERLLPAMRTRFAAAYGTSTLDRPIEARFNEIFEREVSVFFVATGTAANSLALASVNRPGGVVFCHSRGACHRGRMRRAGFLQRHAHGSGGGTARQDESGRTWRPGWPATPRTLSTTAEPRRSP
jgi:hypothetical protein